MFTYKQAQYNWEKGYYSVVKDKNNKYGVFSTKDGDGDLRRSFLFEDKIDKAVKNIGFSQGIDEERFNHLSEKYDWQLVKTIHPTELMGEGFNIGDKVKVLPDAEEKCRKNGLTWNYSMQRLIEKEYIFFNNKIGSDYFIKDEDGFLQIFPPTALAPVFEEKDEEKEKDEEEKVKKAIEILEKAGKIKDGKILE